MVTNEWMTAWRTGKWRCVMWLTARAITHQGYEYAHVYAYVGMCLIIAQLSATVGTILLTCRALL